MIPPSRRNVMLRVAMGQEQNQPLLQQARAIQEAYDISGDDFDRMFTTRKPGTPKVGLATDPFGPTSRAARGRSPRTGGPFVGGREGEPVELFLTAYGQQLFDRDKEIKSIRSETERMRTQPYGRVRARRTGLARG